MDALTAFFSFLKNPTSAQAFIAFALVVGGLVRILRTKKVGEILDAIPVTWIKRIPKWLLPWVALLIGFVLTTLNAWLNAGHSLGTALAEGLAGLVLSGGGAIGGHETFAKLLGLFIYKPTGPIDPPPPLPGVDAPPVTPEKKAEAEVLAVVQGTDKAASEDAPTPPAGTPPVNP